MAGCSHDCANCSEKCSKESLLVPANQASNVKHVIGVVSGKGGVGKSLVTSMLAVTMQRRGYKAAILDADITGPSIPKAFGLKTGMVEGNDLGMFPVMTKTGIEVMSLNLLVDDETKPVVWRGPVIAGTVKQFWSDVVWNDVDYMFVDMPPGTGDVPLTVFQSLPLDGDSHIEKLADNYGTSVLAKLPIDPELASLCDKGVIELFEGDYMERAADFIENKLN